MAHIHLYQFGLRVGVVEVWSCARPDCNHYMPNHMRDVMKFGKSSYCWSCGYETIALPSRLHQYPAEVRMREHQSTLYIHKVLCPNCIASKKSPKTVKQLLEQGFK